MAATTIQDQVAALLARRVAEGKVRGVPSPEVEAAALFDSIAINLATHPRAVLYLAHLAKNGLLKAVSDELAAVEEVLQAIADLSNISFVVKDTRALEKARVALTQVETQDRLIASDATFIRFDQAVTESLKLLSANVVAPGATQLVRPAREAELDLSTLYAAVQAAHGEVLDRLYALAVGVDNFLASPVLSIIGISTVQAVREDIEQMLATVGADDAAYASRDIATRLLVGRAALRVLGTDVAVPYDGSSLSLMWAELQPAAESASREMLASDFGQDLKPLDLAVAGLSASAPAGKIAEARRAFTSLQAVLQNVTTALQVTRPYGIQEEKRVVDGILTSLEERGYDRAASMLLRCQIAEMFELDWQMASFAGTLMKAGADIARTDLLFENREREG